MAPPSRPKVLLVGLDSVDSARLGTFRGRLATGRVGNHRPTAFTAVAGPARTSPRVASLRSIVGLSHFVRDLLIGAPASGG